MINLLKITHIFLSFFFISSISLTNAKVPDVITDQKCAVITIHVIDKHGTNTASGRGFIIDENGVVATSCNIIEQWYEEAENILSIKMADNTILPLDELISPKCTNNLVLLKVRADSLPAINLVQDYLCKKGEHIFFIDDVSEPEMTVVSGIIKKCRENDSILEISIPVTPELSGTPVFNSNNKVIGALVFLSQKNKDIGFAVPLKDLKNQLHMYKRNLRRISEIKKDEGEKSHIIKEFVPVQYNYELSRAFKRLLTLYQYILRSESDLVKTYINLGIEYYKLGKYADAIDAYQQAIQIKPDSFSAYNKLGAAYIMNRNYSAACESFRNAVDIEPSDPVAHFNLGIAYFLKGDKTSAFKESLILEDIDMEYADALNKLIH